MQSRSSISLRSSPAAGINPVMQDCCLAPAMTVAEAIFWAAKRPAVPSAQGRDASGSARGHQSLGVAIDVDTPVSELSRRNSDCSKSSVHSRSSRRPNSR